MTNMLRQLSSVRSPYCSFQTRGQRPRVKVIPNSEPKSTFGNVRNPNRPSQPTFGRNENSGSNYESRIPGADLSLVEDRASLFLRWRLWPVSGGSHHLGHGVPVPTSVESPHFLRRCLLIPPVIFVVGRVCHGGCGLVSAAPGKVPDWFFQGLY